MNDSTLFFCRYVNTADIELRHAAFEQQKITEKRLKDTFARQEAPLDSNSVVDRRAANLASQLGSTNKTGTRILSLFFPGLYHSLILYIYTIF
jgi:hypothetical protein